MSRRTIGRKWPRNSSITDHTVRCDYCGVPWRKDLLWRDMDGLLNCPREGDGRCAGELARANAMSARRGREDVVATDGGAFYDRLGDDNFAHRTTREDI